MVYVSNYASIASFTVDATGALALATGWGVPNNVAQVELVVEPSGKFMYVACSYANFISAYSIDANSGALTRLPGTPYTTSAPIDWLAVATMH